MIKKIFFCVLALLILLFLMVKAWFYLTFPFIEAKTKARFGYDFVYVYDQSDGGQGHFPPDYVCAYKFSEIPKGPLFERVVMFKIGWHGWGQKRRYMSRGAYLRPLHFGVIDGKNRFYYWSYFAWDYINPFLSADYALRDIGRSILKEREKCRSMASMPKEVK